MPRTLVLIPAATLLIVSLAGCAHGPRLNQGASLVAKSPEERREVLFPRLKKLAARQAADPVVSATPIAPPPGLDASLAQSVSDAAKDAGARAMIPLNQAIETYAAKADMPKLPTDQGVDEGDEDDDDRAEAAAKAYISGRQKLLSNEVADAVLDLREATKLDPGAHEPWRELGEAYLAGGSRTEALDAFKAAVARGERSPRTLELLARAAAERGDTVQAAAWYSLSSQNDPERFDPILSQVVYVGLSQSLRKEGYLTASKDALRRALMANGTLSASTRYSREAGEVFRRQGDLWRDVGDDELRLGQFDRAMEAYERADDFPSVDGQTLTPRYVFAAVRAGQPASGALYVLESMADHDGRASADDLAMLHYLAVAANLGSMISSDLDGMRAVFPSPLPPSIASSLARAKATVQDEREARRTLVEALETAPGDTRLASAFVDTFRDPELATEQAVRLIDHDSRVAIPLAEALLNSELALDAIERAIEARGHSTAGVLLDVYFAALQGRFSAAVSTIERIATEPGSKPALALAYADMKFSAGALIPPSLSDSQLAQGTPESRRVAARLLMMSQKYQAAEDIASSLLDGPDNRASIATRMSDLMLLAELNAALNRGDVAEALVRRAAALDPYDDRPVSMLLTLLGPGGAASAPGKLNAVIRDLRTNMPESRTARVLRAREALRRSLFALAEREAKTLVNEDPSDAAALDTLVSVWQRSQAQQGAAVIARGIDWMERNLARRPQAPAPLAGLATLLIAQNQAEAATARLRLALSQGAGPDVSRTLERVLRDELKRPTEADALLRSRVEAAPRTILASFEYAELLLRNGDQSEAADALLSAITPDITLVGDQPQRVLSTISALLQVVAKEQTDTNGKPPTEISSLGARVLSLFDLLASRRVRFAPELHEARLILMAEDRNTPFSRTIQAVSLLAEQHPDQSLRPIRRTSAIFRATDRNPQALDLMEAGASLVTPDADMATEWFVLEALAGDATRGKGLIDRLASLHDDALLRKMLERFSAAQQLAAAKDLRSEAAYVLGNLLSSEGHDEESLKAYELALSYQPDHPWAANNLGYALAEKGRDVERASTLLEIAYAALPNEASIVDSLGWLRYKQNILADRTDANGTITRRGAVSLLDHAASLLAGNTGSDATVLEHAGDASWLFGRFEQAERYWRDAQQQSQGVIDLAASTPSDRQTISSSRLEEVKRIHASVTQKIDNVSKRRPVSVAPQFQNMNPMPAQWPPVPEPERKESGMRPAPRLAPPLAPTVEHSHDAEVVTVPFALPDAPSPR
jgi:tetratricopeptide (TPR) repeat protein